jgi:hypothetical protein
VTPSHEQTGLLEEIGARKDHVTRAALERSEADQPLAAAHVEQALPRCKAGAVEHLVSNCSELFQHLAARFRIAAVAVIRQPLSPDVAVALRTSH